MLEQLRPGAPRWSGAWTASGAPCGTIDTTTPAGRLAFHIFASLAQFECELIVGQGALTVLTADENACGTTGAAGTVVGVTLPAAAPPRLVDGDLVLRELTGDDGWLEQDLSRDPDVVRFTTYPPDLIPEQTAARWERYVAARARGVLVRYVLELAGQAVGTAGAGAGADRGSVEVFYAVLPRARRRRVATQAARLLAGWARAAGATLVELATHGNNTASQGVAAAAGVVRAGYEVRTVKGVETRLVRWRWAPDFAPAGNQGERPDLYDIENAALDPDGHVLAAMCALAPWAGRDLLDLGCGSGWWLPGYADGVGPGGSVVGVEPDPRLVSLAAARDSRVPVLTGSAEHIPLPADSVDVVHARFAYFFPPGCDAGLAEVLRVLRPGGSLVVVDNDLRHGEFATLLVRSPWAAAQGTPDTTDAWWRERGAVRTEVASSWRFDRREDLEAVLRLELPPEIAYGWLAEHPDRLGLSYGYALFSVTS